MNDLLNILKCGSKEEIGKALVELSRQKDPKYNTYLKELMNSGDQFISAMAAYAIGESGDQEGFNFLNGIFKTGQSLFLPQDRVPDLHLLEEIIKLPDEINSAMALYNRSYLQESKNKLLKILQIYAAEIPKTNVNYFDALAEYVIKKTRGLFLDALSMCEFTLGNIKEALRYSSDAISLGEETGDLQLLKIAIGDHGYIQMGLGNYYTALDLIHKSLDIDETSNDPWRKKNRPVSVLSQLYYEIGQYDKALAYSQEAMELSERENDLIGVAKCANALGIILCDLGDLPEAKNYLEKALTLSEKLDNKALQSIVLNNKAFLDYSFSKIEDAKANFIRALELATHMSDKSSEGIILSNMAKLEFEMGDVEGATQHAEAALNIARIIHSPANQACAHFILGSIEDFGNDDMTAAHEHYKEAIKFSETLRKNINFDDLKMSFAANNTISYQQMISLCFRMGRIDDVFEYIERSKSRSLVDMLSSAFDSIGSKNLPSEQLEEIADLKARLEFLRKQLSASISIMEKGSSDKRNDTLEEELAAVERQYVDIFEELKYKDPEWVSLSSIDVDNISAIQETLDHGTVVLELYQTADELIVVVISRDFHPYLVLIQLDVAREAETVLNLFESLSYGNELDIRSHEYIKNIKQPLSYFYDLIMIPIFEKLKSIKNLIIIPHNFWHYLPFHALYDKSSEEYLIDKLPISYAPSATTLSLCCKGEKPQYRNALILANPSRDLPYTEEEAEKIAARFGRNSHVFKNEQAIFDRLSEYNDCDVIHLACHGFFRGDEPLFSHLLLADQSGGTTPVFLPDIFNLRLNPNFVSLSACETGLNELTGGDELIGISRAFFYAGARSLLTSLWTVNDKSTSLLMDKFYEELLTTGASRTTSLQTAAKMLKNIPEYSHPYFWAPFFLSGDWR
jgi:CHAT domain-containing protein/Tfp pilus assembly protein PilF